MLELLFADFKPLCSIGESFAYAVRVLSRTAIANEVSSSSIEMLTHSAYSAYSV